MSKKSIKIPEDWFSIIGEEFEKEYFKDLKRFLYEEKQNKKTILPPGRMIFSAFNYTKFNNIKVVIIGQDPYHDIGQAHGLCFSVPNNMKRPPSLLNIFKEINRDIKIPIPQKNELFPWAKQGVLLLNSVLTVEAHKPASHQKKGWEIFSDAVIKSISDHKLGIIFLLWGNFAISKKDLIDSNKHYILTTTHPSPLSANRGFLGCGHFSKTNEILKSIGKKIIDWKL